MKLEHHLNAAPRVYIIVNDYVKLKKKNYHHEIIYKRVKISEFEQRDSCPPQQPYNIWFAMFPTDSAHFDGNWTYGGS